MVQGEFIVSNDEALRMFDADHGLTLDSRSHFRCKDENSQMDLIKAISNAQIHANKTRAENLLAIRSSATADPLLVEVSPLRDTLDELNYGLDGVLVQLIDTRSRSYCSVDSFATAYNISEAEKTVTALLLDGLTNREIAEERGTGIETVKSQITSIMQKADATSRVELVRRALKTQPPVR